MVAGYAKFDRHKLAWMEKDRLNGNFFINLPILQELQKSFGDTGVDILIVRAG